MYGRFTRRFVQAIDGVYTIAPPVRHLDSKTQNSSVQTQKTRIHLRMTKINNFPVPIRA